MKVTVCTVLLISILMIAVISCSMPSKSSDGSEREMLSKKKLYYLDNINTTEILIEHIGIIDKPIHPILFKCSGDANAQKVEVTKIEVTSMGSPVDTALGHEITLNIDEYREVLNIIFSKSSDDMATISNFSPNAYGIFRFTIYNKQEKTVFIFRRETSIKVFKEITAILRNNTNAEIRGTLEDLLKLLE